MAFGLNPFIYAFMNEDVFFASVYFTRNVCYIDGNTETGPSLYKL